MNTGVGLLPRHSRMPLTSCLSCMTGLKETPNSREFHHDLNHFVGRPTSLYFAERLTGLLGGAKVYLKKRGPESHRSA